MNPWDDAVDDAWLLRHNDAPAEPLQCLLHNKHGPVAAALCHVSAVAALGYV